MKRLITIIALAAIAACALTSCHKVNRSMSVTATTMMAQVKTTTATLTGKISITGGTAKDLDYVEAGFKYATKSDMSDAKEVLAPSIASNFEFTATVTGLTPDTEYYFCAFSRYGGNVHTGSIVNFKTQPLSI